MYVDARMSAIHEPSKMALRLSSSQDSSILIFMIRFESFCVCVRVFVLGDVFSFSVWVFSFFFSPQNAIFSLF